MKTNWRAWGETAAVLSVVVSLVFVGVELRLNRSIAVNESFAATAEFSVSLQSLLAEHSNVWRRGCAGDELSEDESSLFLALVRAHDGVNFSKWQRSRRGITGARPGQWIDTIAMHMFRYEGYRYYWRINAASRPTPEALRGLKETSGYSFEIEQRYEEFNKIGISNQFPISVCGAS